MNVIEMNKEENKELQGEVWKVVRIDHEYTNKMRFEISNYGRLRSFNNVSNGNIVHGSMVSGYRILRAKLFRARSEEKQKRFDYMNSQIIALNRRVKELKKEQADPKKIEETESLLASLKKTLSAEYKKDEKERAFNFQPLFHRLVADHFLPPPTPDQKVVAHLDHNKLNNHVDNIKWMTLEENYKHQQTSPLVIAVNRAREQSMYRDKVAKLTVTQVMFLKKLHKEGKTVKNLARQFKVSDMQIKRIIRGENWADIVI